MAAKSCMTEEPVEGVQTYAEPGPSYGRVSTNDTEYRKQLAAMFAGAARREFDLLLVWSLDRFSREGMAATVAHLRRLASHGVAFRSFTEEHLSTENELVRNILLATLSSLAKLEREKISQRTKAGLERARAKGKVLGRPRFSDGDRDKLLAALGTGDSWHAVSKATRIPYSTVKKHLRALGYEPQRANAATKTPMVGGDPASAIVSQG